MALRENRKTRSESRRILRLTLSIHVSAWRSKTRLYRLCSDDFNADECPLATGLLVERTFSANPSSGLKSKNSAECSISFRRFPSSMRTASHSTASPMADIPPLWTGPAEPRFKVVISSGHFNDWNVKTTDLTQGTSFLFYPSVLDMFSFDLLRRFNHSEIAMLVAPRAFMIEAGATDGVIIAPRRFADAEMTPGRGIVSCAGNS